MAIDQAYTALTAEVRTRLVQEFSLEELRDLCFDLGIDYELFPQQQHTMARELVGYLHRRRRIPQLVERMQAIRPDEDYSFVARAGVEFAAQTQAIQPLPQKDPAAEIEVLWSRQLDARPYPTQKISGSVCIIPAVAEQHGLYVTDLFALDASIGELRWRQQFKNLIFSGDVALGNGIVASMSSASVLTGAAVVVAFAPDGSLRWQITCDGQHVSAPAVHGNKVVVVLDADTTLVLDARTGAELERFALPDSASDHAPLVTKAQLYFPCQGPRLMAMTWDGDEAWIYDAGTTSQVSLSLTPLLVGDRLITVSSKGLVSALHPSTGELAWEYNPGVRLNAVANVFYRDDLIFGGGDAVLYALSARQGEEHWSIDVDGVIPSSIVMSDSCLICSDLRGFVTAYDSQTGQQLWRYNLDGRIETQLAVMPDNAQGPVVIAVDTLGKVTAFSYPVSADAHEQANRWNLAAQVWETNGECVRAARSWEKYANYLDGHGALDTLQAKAWESAAKMWLAVGEAAQAARCQRKRARFLELPLISASLEHKGVILGAHTQLHIILENSGYGTALDVQLDVESSAFEIAASSELSMAHLAPGQKRIRNLDVLPTAHGETVPLYITLRYRDSTGRMHRVRDTIYVAVVSEDLLLTPETLSLFSQTSLGDMQDTRTEVIMDMYIRPGRSAYMLEIVLDDGQTFTSNLPANLAQALPVSGVKARGRYLFDQVFGKAEGRDAWSNALGQSMANSIPRRLRLRIDESLPELAALPWESMHAGDLMLAASDQILFSRNLPVKWVDRAIDISEPLKVLIVVSNPEDIFSKYQLPPLDAPEEKLILTQALKQQTHRDVQLHLIKSPVTLDRLHRAARSGYDMMHIIGHGYVNPRSGTSGVILETVNHRSRAVSWPQFSQLFAQISNVPMLMYFSVCQRTSQQFELQPQALPNAMIRAGIPAVVAMQDRIAITANRVLTQHFYADLLEHGSVDLALQAARAAVLSKELKGAETPVLYTQLPSGRLW